jgi:hypothetical protein
MIRITKDTLRQLNGAIGKLDVDTGKRVVGFIGRLEMADGLYHGEVHYSETGDDPPWETVSIRSIISPDAAPDAAPVHEDTEA